MRSADHLHTPEVRAKIARALCGNTNGRHTRGIRKPGSRASGVRNLIELGVPARMASPLSGPFATCVWAREYDLIDPSGVRHTGANLALFVREHRELFLPADLVPETEGDFPRTRAARKLQQLLNEDHRHSWKGWSKP